MNKFHQGKLFFIPAWSDQGEFAMRDLARLVISDNNCRQDWWPLLLWRFDIFLILSCSLSSLLSPLTERDSLTVVTSRGKNAQWRQAGEGWRWRRWEVRSSQSGRTSQRTRLGEPARHQGSGQHCCHLWPGISRSCTGERTQGNIPIFGGISAASPNPQCWY